MLNEQVNNPYGVGMTDNAYDLNKTGGFRTS